MAAPLPVDIQPLTRERLPELAALFAEGGDPKRCWCAFWRVRGSSWQDWNPETNRKVLEAAVGRDRAPGLVAYADGRAVGWVSVGPREDYERLEHSKVLARLDDRPVWSIVCFVVSRSVRGRGVARALLDAAVDFARDHGATLVEGYPIEPAGRVPSASAYTGTLSMFERAGFRLAARRQWNRSAVRPIVRRRIRPRRRVRHPSRVEGQRL